MPGKMKIANGNGNEMAMLMNHFWRPQRRSEPLTSKWQSIMTNSQNY